MKKNHGAAPALQWGHANLPVPMLTPLASGWLPLPPPC